MEQETNQIQKWHTFLLIVIVQHVERIIICFEMAHFLTIQTSPLSLKYHVLNIKRVVGFDY